MTAEVIREMLLASAQLKQTMADTLAEDIDRVADLIRASLKNGGKVLLMGNGGSAADAQHIAAELIGRYKRERRALPALALTVDTSALTAIGNDYGYEFVFSRQIEGLARKGDVVIGISTSGNSDNVIRGLEAAEKAGAATVALLGKGGGKTRDRAQISLVVPSNDTARIQEAHITLGHIICELLDSEG